ncbi:MAG: ankyrin repeat domain-containing protein [Halanaerobiales bacterium]|nr:ankyrin repeat domain-containing protein [Halanaerobiales bacterium]
MIGQILVNLPSEIQNTHFPKILKESIIDFLTMYKKLVIKMPSAFASRTDILQIICPHFIDFFAIQIQHLKDTYSNIDHQFPQEKYWFLPNEQKDTCLPMEKLLNWWLEVCGIENLNQFAQKVGTQILDENYAEQLYKKLNKWKSGTIPTWTSIYELVDENVSYDIENQAQLKQSFMINALIARAVQIIFQKVQEYLGYETFDMILELFKITSDTMEVQPEKVFSISKQSHEIINIDIESCPPKYNLEKTQRLINKFFNMSNTVTNINTEKKDGDENIAKQTLEELSKSKAFSNELKFLISWNKGIYYTLLYDYNKALKEYEKAFEEGKLRGGYLLKEIIRQGITVSAHLNKPAAFKKFYKWALTYDLFSDPYEKVEDWILHDQSKQFFNIFPPKSYYTSVSKKINKLYQEKGLSWIINRTEWENRKTDLRNPNRYIKGFGPTPLTQLMIFGVIDQVDKVKKLFKAGANPNEVDKNGTTALMHCLIGSSRETALLLLNEDITESINSRTKKKRVTALSLAIDMGDLELVEKIIEKGADIHQKCSPDGEDGLSPLYYTISQIGYAHLDKTFYKKPIKPADYLKGLKIDDSIKYHGRALFDSEVIAHSEALKNKFNDKDFKALMNIPIKMAQENLSKYYEIVETLIKHGADINKKHFRHGFTPFLYSAEIGDIKLFSKLVEKGANLSDRLDDGTSFFHLSIGWGSLDLVNYILDHLDVQQFLNSPRGKSDYPIHRAVKLFQPLTPENSNILYTILDKLLVLKPNLNVKNDQGQTPLSIAHELGNLKLIDKLVKAGAGEIHSSGIILFD